MASGLGARRARRGSGQGADAVLKSLRWKFVGLTMATVTLVLAATFATICYLDYRQSVDTVYEQLEMAVGRHLVPGHGRFSGPHSEGDDAAEGLSADEAQRPLPPEIGGARGGALTVPMAVYLVYPDGDVAVSLEGSTASISSDVLADALARLGEEGALDQGEEAAAGSHQEGRRCGQLAGLGLFYCVQPMADGAVVAFADAGNVASWEQLALLLAGIGVLVLAVFFGISLFFARWALRPVELAWGQQQQFIADASHELKTPLTVILANTSILRSRPAETIADQRQWVESTQVEAERMQALVNDMLELARPQSAPGLGDGAAATPVDFSDLVEGEALQFEAVAYERGIQLDSQVQEGLFVTGQEARLKRLAAILLDNACKYAEPAPSDGEGAGGHAGEAAEGAGESAVGKAAGEAAEERDTARIWVNLQRDGAFAQMTVRNTGPAISPDDLPHLFDRFYRADKARTKGEADASGAATGGGYGLGLAIARDIVRAHGGTIAVTSSNGEGTAFTVRLPLA